MKKIIIAIDGYSSCGKSTMAKELARRAGYIYIDTGAMYRAVTLYAMRAGLFDAAGGIDAEALERVLPQVHVSFTLAPDGSPHTMLNGHDVEADIRSLEVSSHVSSVAALPAVRRLLTEQQRAMGRDKGIVMDGRDIGTSVFPQAELKVFVTASAQVRAQRRYDELRAKGRNDVTLEAVRRNVEERDYIDTHREVSPLRQAPDALVLDNSHLTRQEQSDWLMEQYRRAVQE